MSREKPATPLEAWYEKYLGETDNLFKFVYGYAGRRLGALEGAVTSAVDAVVAQRDALLVEVQDLKSVLSDKEAELEAAVSELLLSELLG